MKFTFASWNLNNRSLHRGHIRLLQTVDCDLFAVQEATDGFHSELSKASLFDWSVSSLTLRPPRADEGRARRHGCSVFGRSPFRSDSWQVLTEMHFPERALVVQTVSASGPLTVCSFHIPPGASWGIIKPQTMKAIAEWLGTQPGSVVVGMDANSPKTDHPDPLKNEWWWKDEPSLLGPAPLHQLRDAFRRYLSDRQDLLDTIQADRPGGPLAISYVRGRGLQKIPCRYDVILVSPNVMVNKVEYLPLNDALSDHALVVSHLELRALLQEPVVWQVPARRITRSLGQHQHGSIQMNPQGARKRPRLNFDTMGIPFGSVLKSVVGNITVQVTGPHAVCLEGIEMTLTEATRNVLGQNWNGNPCPQWTFKGKSVGKIYNETYGPS